ncbi:MAG: hypothetical protein IJQ45_02610 [Clostridia bacterium]|nr:hypothetical protein [Clostridia bacterium]MBR0205618.1 hypothetical protein [Clostridia bacterium]
MIFVADMQSNKGEHKVTGKEEMPFEEYREFMHGFDFLKEVSQVKPAYEIVCRNGYELISFMDNKNLMNLYESKKMELEKLGVEGNRMLFNFCVSFRTFMDYAARAVSHRKEAKNAFDLFVKKLFDKSLEYRLFYKLRNFCAHYAFPFSRVECSSPGKIEIICEKRHLLEYDGWGRAKEDIEKMPDMINICQHVNQLLVIVTVVLQQTFYFFTEDYFNANKAIAELAEKHSIQHPIFLERSEIGDLSLHPIPFESIKSGMDIIKSHPNVHFSLVNKAEEMKITYSETKTQ